MKFQLKILFACWQLIALFLASCASPPNYQPSTFLTSPAQDSAIAQIVHYAAKLPPRATIQTRFDTAFARYYRIVAPDYKFLYLSPVVNKRRSFYFLITRPARSVTPMYEGIGGELALAKNDSLAFYNEIFRTWKMPLDTLKKRSLMLFEHMIMGRDLSVFYPKYSTDHYIEFPDGRFSFDTTRRVWADQLTDSLDIQQLP